MYNERFRNRLQEWVYANKLFEILIKESKEV